MTVAISCNLPDGVILGVDSAVTTPAANGTILKIFENAEKLFQLGNKSVGVATYGVGLIEGRGIGSYLREFELADPNKVVSTPSKLEDTVEELRLFFTNAYKRAVIPELEKATGKKFDDIPEKPLLGLIVGGFSANAFLSEVWEIQIPIHNTPKSATCRRAQGSFGGDWFALSNPIVRYTKGFDPALLDELTAYFASIRGTPFSPQEGATIKAMLQKHEYQIPFGAMPMEEGVRHVKFLVEMVINHHRFTVGAPVVGGAVRIGKVTYKGEKFQIIGEAQ